MNARLHLLALAGLTAASLAFTGCKKPAEDAAAVDENGKTAAAAVPEKGDAEAKQAISTANAAIQKNDYDAALAALVAAKQSGAMSDDQKAQYRQSLRDVSDKLLEASATDAKAREAYENLGRMMKGR